MRYTNNHNLPAALHKAITHDDYSKGDAEYSVTELITHPRIVMLQRLNKEHIVVDISERIPSLLGKTLHKIVEDAAEEHEITEERFFATVEGVKVSGAVDLQIPLDNGSWEINDYKLTSVYSVMSEKIEWEQQLNLYGALARRNGREVTRLRIVAILKDWSRKMVGIKAGYPPCQVMMVEIPVWDADTQEQFLRDRVVMHMKAREAVDGSGTVDYCSDRDRWIRDRVWAVMKKGRQSAVKLYDNQQDAETAAAASDELYIEYRAGTPTRCEGNYCLVSAWCRQYQQELGGGTGGGSGGGA